jgi:hypothetical protein
MCMVSMPAMMRLADPKDLNPIIGRMRRLIARWSCSTRLFKYFDWRKAMAAPLSAIKPRTATVFAPLLCCGRDGNYFPPPAQIPACGFPAPGSSRKCNAIDTRDEARVPIRGRGPCFSDGVRHWVRSLAWSTHPPSERGPSLHALRSWAPQPCSGASQVLLPRPTPRHFLDGFASSASRRGPEPPEVAVGKARSPRFRHDPFARDVALDPGRASGPCMAVPHI